MPCYKPLTAWRTEDGEIVFAERGRIKNELTLACGQCIGCRLERSRQWAVRCMHEAQMHRYNCFLTLTLNDEHLTEPYYTGKQYPNGQPAYAGTLNVRDTQLFFKRLRKAIHNPPVGGSPFALKASQHREAQPARHKKPCHAVRYYLGAEYGEQYQRPHYHVCLFGVDFTDKKYFGRSPSGAKLYRSPTLEKLWPLGYSTIGELNFETAAYTARYVMKKITGQQQKTHYEKIDAETGEIKQLRPEYNNMSRRPGIGKTWLEKYQSDVYPHGKVIVRGKKQNPPRYYDKIFKELDAENFEILEYERHKEGKRHHEDQTEARLKVREQVARAKIKQLKRKI